MTIIVSGSPDAPTSLVVSQSPDPILQFWNNAGEMNSGGTLLTQVGGVNYPTYEDAAGTIPLPNPIPLNSRGEVSNAAGQSRQLFIANGVTYTFTLYDKDGNQLNQATSVTGNPTDLATVTKVQNGTYVLLGSVAGTNTITASLTPASTGYVAGQQFLLIPANTITGSATIAIDGHSALTLKKSIGGALVNLVQGDLIANVPAAIALEDASTPVVMNPQTYTHGADIASNATINLDTATGDLVDVTGTTTITAITLSEGRCATVRFTGILTLTYNASTLILPGSANITTAAGDYAIFRGYAAGVVRCVVYTPKAVIPGGTFPDVTRTIASGSLSLVGDTTISIPAGAYKRIDVEINGLTSGADFVPYWRVNADTGANYDYIAAVLQAGGLLLTAGAGATGMALVYASLKLDNSGATPNPVDVVLTILNPTNTTLYKVLTTTVSAYRGSAAGAMNTIPQSSGRWLSTAAITQLSLLLRQSTGTSPSGGTANATSGTYIVRGYL